MGGMQDFVCTVPVDAANLRFGLNNNTPPVYPFHAGCIDKNIAYSVIQALQQFQAYVLSNTVDIIFLWDNSIVLGNAKKYGNLNRKPNIPITHIGGIKITRRNIANDEDMSIVMICPTDTTGINQWVGLMYYYPEFKNSIDQFNEKMLQRWASQANTSYDNALLKYTTLLNNYVYLNSGKSSYGLLSARSLSSNNGGMGGMNGMQSMQSMQGMNNGGMNGMGGMQGGMSGTQSMQGMNNGSMGGMSGTQSMQGMNNGSMGGMGSMNGMGGMNGMQGGTISTYPSWNSASSINDQYAGMIVNPSPSLIEYNPPTISQNADCYQRYEIIRSFLENTGMKLVPRKKGKNK